MTAGTFFTRRLAALTWLNTSDVTRRYTAAQQRFASDVTLKTMVGAFLQKIAQIGGPAHRFISQ